MDQRAQNQSNRPVVAHPVPDRRAPQRQWECKYASVEAYVPVLHTKIARYHPIQRHFGSPRALQWPLPLPQQTE